MDLGRRRSYIPAVKSSAKILGFVCAALAWLVLSGTPAPSFDFSRTTLEIGSRPQALQQPKRFDIGRSELPSSIRDRTGGQSFLKRGGPGAEKFGLVPAAVAPVWAAGGEGASTAAALDHRPHLSRSSNRPRAPPLPLA